MATFQPEQSTVKTRQAIAHAQAMARELGHPEVGTPHLLMATVTQEGGLVRQLLERSGVHGAAVERALQEWFARQPKVQGGEVRPTRELVAALDLAAKEAESLHDKYVSTEHLILAFLSDDAARAGIRAGEILRELGRELGALARPVRRLRRDQCL